MNKTGIHREQLAGFTLVEMLVVITILGILIALAVPNFMRAKEKAQEAQTQTGLHSIQMDLERFATDNGGYYPAYIWGGSINSWCWDTVNSVLRASCSTQSKVNPSAPDVNLVLDPLIRYGYRTSYPRNPFIATNQSLCGPLLNDPRFGCPITAEFDSLMGNIMMDPNVPDSGFGGINTIGYNPRLNTFFPAGDDAARAKWIPGEFFYRSWNSRRDRSWCANAPGVPVAGPFPHTDDAGFIAGQTAARANCETDAKAEYYLLGAYGAIRTPGSDLVCDPVPPTPGPNIGCDYNGRGNAPDPPPAQTDRYYGQTGGVNDQYIDGLPNVLFFDAWDQNNNGLLSNDLLMPVGSTEYGADGLEINSQQQRAGYGEPDGKPDGIILVFASGSPMPGQK